MKRLWFIAVIAACGKSSDSGNAASKGDVSCRDAGARVAAVVENPKMVDSFVEACTKEEWAPEIRTCFANVKTQDDIVECQDRTRKTDKAKSFGKLAEKNEAQVNLEKLRVFAKETFVKTGAFPAVTAPLTPAEDCCKGPHKRCRPSVSGWATPAWEALGFGITSGGGHRFRYSYEGSATKFVAKAVGDLDCDGVPITYEVRGSVREGAPHFDIVDPPPNTD